MTDHLWLSPHLDDAVLSCGGAIARAVAVGESVEVLTLFTGTAPAGTTSPFIERLHAAWQLDAADVMDTRVIEDRRALARLGAAPSRCLGLLDAVYRRPRLYVDMETLLGPIGDGDDVVEQVLRALEDTDARVVHAPLAAGGHVDHRAVRQAAELRFGDRVRLYEDVPYVFRPGMIDARGLEAIDVDVTPHIEAKIEAIACYGSQLASLFGGDMPAEVRAYHRRADRYVEREWGRRDEAPLGHGGG